MKPDVLNVADYILNHATNEMTMPKLQRLVYYAQAWHIAWYSKKLFTNKIEAWQTGPVCPDLWYALEQDKKTSILDRKTFKAHNDYKFSRRQKETMNKILMYYEHFSGTELSKLTQKDDPWKNARKGVVNNNEPRKITKLSMERYYKNLYAGGKKDEQS